MNKHKSYLAKKEAIEEIIILTKKLHLYNAENKYYAELRIKELVERHKVTYGDISDAKKKEKS